MRVVLLFAMAWLLPACGRLVVPSELRPVGHPLLELGPRMTLAGGSYTARPRAAAPVTPLSPGPIRPEKPTASQTARAKTARGARKPGRSAASRGATPVRPSAPRRTTRTAKGRRRPTRARRPVRGRVASGKLDSGRRTVRRNLEAMAGRRRIGKGPLTDAALLRRGFARTGRPLVTARSVDDAWRNSAPIRRAAEPGDLLFFQPAPKVPRVCVVRRRLRGGVLEAACVTRSAVRWVRVSSSHPDARRRQGRVINTFLRPRRRSDPKRARYLAGQLLWQIRSPFPD